MVFDHGGHPVTIGTVLPWQEVERFHLQVDQVSQWISPRDFVLHCLTDFRAFPSGWLGHGGCRPLDGCFSSRYIYLGNFIVRGWAPSLTLSICVVLFLKCVVLAASQPDGCRLLLC